MHKDVMRKEMRKVVALSVICVALCATLLTSATMALFVVEVDSPENVVTVAEITGSIAVPFGMTEGEKQTLPIIWEGTAPGYCAFTLTGSEAGDVTYYMERPAEAIPDPADMENWDFDDPPYSLVNITFHEPGTALGDYYFSWGEPPVDSTKIEPDAEIEYGTKFVANAKIDNLSVDSGELLYEAGVYVVNVEWTEATTDGYCAVTLTAKDGSDSAAEYYLPCPNDGEKWEHETSFLLTLNVDTVVQITPHRGEVPFGGEVLISEITYGNLPAFSAAVSVDGSPYHVEDSSSETFYLNAGDHTLSIDWRGATYPGTCILQIEGAEGSAVYTMDCALQGGQSQSVNLQLNVDAAVTVITEKGSVSASGMPATDLIVYGTAAPAAVDNTELTDDADGAGENLL